MRRSAPTKRNDAPIATAPPRPRKLPPPARPQDVGARPYIMDGIKARAREIGARSELPAARRYVVTCAQNNTNVHEEFLASLRTYCAHNDAELVVIPLLYRNPTSPDEDKRDEQWWDFRLNPYYFAGRQRVGDLVDIYADVKLQPTRSAPTSGMEGFAGMHSTVVGHPKLQLRTVPAPSGKMPKILTSTGAVTLENYSQSALGKISEWHHTFGATLIELDGSRFHLRQLNADKTTGEFTDLTKRYTPTGVAEAPQPFALVMGDTHVDFIDPLVEAATFGRGGIVETLNPQNLIWHDLVDGYSVNPHHKNDPFIVLAKHNAKRHVAQDELLRALNYVVEHTPEGAASHIVASNHDDFFRRWMRDNPDWTKIHPDNVPFWHATLGKMLAGLKIDSSGARYPSPLLAWAKQEFRGRTNIHCLDIDESLAFDGIEFCMHGDRGPNGARGSAKNLRRIGVKSVIGHSHSPCIDEGCYQVGTSTNLRLEYNSGPSGWLNTHCIVYADGKRSLINIIEGAWKL